MIREKEEFVMGLDRWLSFQWAKMEEMALLPTKNMSKYQETRKYGEGDSVPQCLPALQMKWDYQDKNLLGEERLANLSKEKSLKHLFPWAFIRFRLHRNTECIPGKLIDQCQAVMFKEGRYS